MQAENRNEIQNFLLSFQIRLISSDGPMCVMVSFYRFSIGQVVRNRFLLKTMLGGGGYGVQMAKKHAIF